MKSPPYELSLLAITALVCNASGKMTQDEIATAMMSGCGPNLSLESSKAYADINTDMHHAMAINFTGNAEYDFVAGMIPHHSAAVDMCEAYEVNAEVAGISNAGIESLCYNITFGPVEWGEWQYDFSQLGENEQMLKILVDLKMMAHYMTGCSATPLMEGRMDGARNEPMMDHTSSSGNHHHDAMFMGCGELDLDQTKEYIKVNMDMHMRMAFNWTGHPGVDFLLGMIPHHQGAIAMCDIYYKYWSCAPGRTVCVDPLPLDEIQSLMGADEKVSVLNKMHHICTGHIMETQPKEVEWMLEELGRLSPEARDMYQTMLVEGTYPCPAINHNMGEETMADDMEKPTMNHNMTDDSNDAMDDTEFVLENMTVGESAEIDKLHKDDEGMQDPESGSSTFHVSITVGFVTVMTSILLVVA